MDLKKMSPKGLQNLIDSLEDGIAFDEDRLNSGTMNPEVAKALQNRVISRRNRLRQAKREQQRRQEVDAKKEADKQKRISEMKSKGIVQSDGYAMPDIEQNRKQKRKMDLRLNPPKKPKIVTGRFGKQRVIPGDQPFSGGRGYIDPGTGIYFDSPEEYIKYAQRMMQSRYWDERQGRWIEGAPTGPGAMPTVLPGGREGVTPPSPPMTKDRGPIVSIQPVTEKPQMVGAFSGEAAIRSKYGRLPPQPFDTYKGAVYGK